MAFAVTREFEATTRWAVPLLLVLSGLWHDDSALWLSTLGYTFTAFFGLVCTMSGLTQLGARYFTMCQPDKNDQLDLLDVEIKATALSLFVASCLAAWPLTFWREGKEVACTTDFSEAAAGFDSGIGWAVVAAKMVLVWLAADWYLYWKHRILHTPAFYIFHKSHHAFHNPTAFAGFAVSPMEALITFGPVLGFSQTLFKFYGPVHVPGIFAFVFLNFYLHAGYVIPALEKLFPLLLINTSAFHNYHHEKTHTHFGEMLTLWDRVYGTDVGYLDTKTGWTVLKKS